MKELTLLECNSTYGGFVEFDTTLYYLQLSPQEQLEFTKVNLIVYAFGFGLLTAGFGTFNLVSTLSTNTFVINGATSLGAFLGAGLGAGATYSGLSYL